MSSPYQIPENYKKELEDMYSKLDDGYWESFILERQSLRTGKMSSALKKTMGASISRSLRGSLIRAQAGGSNKEFLMSVHVAMHGLIAIGILGSLYMFYLGNDLHKTDCFAWYSSIMSSTVRTQVQNTYCTVLQGSVKTVSTGLESVTRAGSMNTLIANIFGILLSLVVGAKTMGKIFSVYNANVMKLTCALLRESYASNYAGPSASAVQADLCRMVVDMVKNAPAVVATPVAVVRPFSVNDFMAASPAAPAPARSASRRSARPAPSAVDQQMQDELEEALNELDSSAESSGATSGTSGSRGTRSSARKGGKSKNLKGGFDMSVVSVVRVINDNNNMIIIINYDDVLIEASISSKVLQEALKYAIRETRTNVKLIKYLLRVQYIFTKGNNQSELKPMQFYLVGENDDSALILQTSDKAGVILPFSYSLQKTITFGDAIELFKNSSRVIWNKSPGEKGRIQYKRLQ